MSLQFLPLDDTHCQRGASWPLLECPELYLYENFCEAAESRRLLAHFLNEHLWPTTCYEVAGRRFELPRQQTWHADPGIVYSFTNNLLPTRPWTAALLQLRRKVSGLIGYEFNAVLVNHYRSGADYVGWHADDEVEMGGNPLIASLSLGAARRFCLRDCATGREMSLTLSSGSLLVMAPPFQQRWQHAVLPDAAISDPRINLTFRFLPRPV